ncbi:MAG: hypothetical protein ACKOD2_16365 [Ilumatobacteraceae bacterium]
MRRSFVTPNTIVRFGVSFSMAFDMTFDKTTAGPFLVLAALLVALLTSGLDIHRDDNIVRLSRA